MLDDAVAKRADIAFMPFPLGTPMESRVLRFDIWGDGILSEPFVGEVGNILGELANEQEAVS